MSPKWYPPTKIAAAAASIAVVGAFGVGAATLAQADVAVDPRAYVSAYGQGENDADKGYRANPTDTDAEANRHDDDVDNQDKSADTDRTAQDAFSDVPMDGASGTTAVNMTGAGTSTATIAGAGEGEGTADGAITGPVLPGGEGGGEAGNPSAPDGGNDPVTPPSADDDPVNPPAPDPSPSPDPTPTPDPIPSDPGTPETPSDGGYDVLPKDPEPEKNTEKGSSDITYVPINGKDPALSKANESDTHVVIMQSSSSDYALYTGQKLDAWTVFCSLSTFFVYNKQPYSWTCSKEEFNEYEYFRIDSFPETVPETTFTVTVSYRVNDRDSWHTTEITCEPTRSCTFILSGETDENGNPVVLGKSYDSTCNLLRYTGQLMSKLGYCPYGNLTHMLLGWKEGDKDVDFLFDATPGRHVVSPGEFVEVPSGFDVGIDFYYLDNNFALGGNNLCYLQRLSNISIDALEFDADGKLTVAVPRGVQSVEIDSYLHMDIDNLVLPSTTMLVNLIGTDLTVNESFALDGDNPYFSIVQDRVLASKDGTQYLGVPMSMDELLVPSNVTNVTLQEGNDVHRIIVEGDDRDSLPQINFETLNQCNVVVPDSLLPTLIKENSAALTFGNGNTVSVASNPGERLSTSYGMVYSQDELKYVADIGIDTVKVNGPHVIASGCFKGNNSVSTVVLTGDSPYTFEEGCFEGGNVSRVICTSTSQKAVIEQQLSAAGVANVQVIVAGRGADGSSYFTEEKDGKPYTTLLEASPEATAFTGIVKGTDGSDIAVDAISSQAFESSENIRWAILGESVSFIGSDAFEGCKNLQGVLVGNTQSVTVESGAFSNCDSLRYVASRAMYANFALDALSSSNCDLYRPLGSKGSDGYIYNFQYFTPESNVTDYTVIPQTDGSYILYGCDSENPWLALASATSLSGEVKLPTTTTEIFIGAFQGVTNDFTLNWSELTNLTYIDGIAFSNSSLCGDVYLGAKGNEFVSIASDAFSGCAKITSLTSESDYFDASSWAFSDCTSLKTVKIAGSAEYRYGWSIGSGVFYGCKSLKSIEFTNANPPALSFYSTGFGFRFDGDYTNTDDWERINLIVPQGSEDAYLEKWVYAFLGYTGYDELHDVIYRQMYQETSLVPSEAEVQKKLAAELLESENWLRKMMGMETVEKSSFITVDEDESGYTFQTMDGETKLISVPADVTTVDLNAIIGSTYSKVTIGADAFAQCKNLERIVVSEKVSRIESGAFNGCDGVEVDFTGSTPPTLLSGTQSNPFDFGAKIKLAVPEKSLENYLVTWTRQCIGLESDEDVRLYATAFFWDLPKEDENGRPYADTANKAVNTPLLEQENYLRSLIDGCAQAESIDDRENFLSFFDAGAEFGLKSRPTEDSKEENAGEGEQGGVSNSNGSTGDKQEGEGGESQPTKPEGDADAIDPPSGNEVGGNQSGNSSSDSETGGSNEGIDHETSSEPGESDPSTSGSEVGSV